MIITFVKSGFTQYAKAPKKKQSITMVQSLKHAIFKVNLALPWCIV